MQKILLMRGIPGAGKTTFLAEVALEVTNLGRTLLICSSDHYHLDERGMYKFDPTKLKLSHGECLRKFVALLLSPLWDDATIAVDNTNTATYEMAPYMALASAYRREALIYTILCEPVVGSARNIHGVPEEQIGKMHKRLLDETGRIPPFWRNTTDRNEVMKFVLGG